MENCRGGQGDGRGGGGEERNSIAMIISPIRIEIAYNFESQQEEEEEETDDESTMRIMSMRKWRIAMMRRWA